MFKTWQRFHRHLHKLVTNTQPIDQKLGAAHKSIQSTAGHCWSACVGISITLSRYVKVVSNTMTAPGGHIESIEHLQ